MELIRDIKEEAVSDESSTDGEDSDAEFITPHILDDDFHAPIKEEKESDGWSDDKTHVKEASTTTREADDALLPAPVDNAALPKIGNASSLSCKVKTEPSTNQSEDEQECEQKITTEENTELDLVIKREIVEEDKEYMSGYFMEDGVNQMKTSENEDSGTETNNHTSAALSDVQLENDDFPQIIPDIDSSEQESISDTNEEMDNQKKHSKIDQTNQKHTVETLGSADKAVHTSQTGLQHVMRHDHSGQKPHNSKLCGKDFKRMYHLKFHEVTHSNERLHSCNTCEKTFQLKQALEQHKQVCHTDERPYACDLCEAAFRLKTTLWKHKAAIHANARPYSCDQCDKTFNFSTILQRHKMLCHSNKRPFPCDVCEKTFKLKHVLQQHKAVCHSDERPYSCDQCDKTFKRKVHLQGHKASCHSDERPHTCDLCESAFKRKCDLQKHQKFSHSNERPYSCDLCEKSYKQKDHLQRHKDMCHSNEGPLSSDVP